MDQIVVCLKDLVTLEMLPVGMSHVTSRLKKAKTFIEGHLPKDNASTTRPDSSIHAIDLPPRLNFTNSVAITPLQRSKNAGSPLNATIK